MGAPASARPIVSQMPNTSAPLVEVVQDVQGMLSDSQGKPITGVLRFPAQITQAWRYLIGTFVQRSPNVSATFTQTAPAAYSQAQMQALIAQVEALSKVVGQ